MLGDEGEDTERKIELLTADITRVQPFKSLDSLLLTLQLFHGVKTKIKNLTPKAGYPGEQKKMSEHIQQKLAMELQEKSQQFKDLQKDYLNSKIALFTP